MLLVYESLIFQALTHDIDRVPSHESSRAEVRIKKEARS